MIKTCNCCQEKFNYKTKLDCGHEYCIICIHDKQSCPVCDSSINDLTFFKSLTRKKYIWLYSTSNGGMWWLYNQPLSKKIEKIYKDYQKREAVSQPIQTIKIKKSKMKKQKVSQSMKQISGFKDFSFKEMKNESLVDFSNYEWDISESSDNEMPTYNLKIGNVRYRIDIANMKQINAQSSYKQRSIMRLEVKNMSIADLKNQHNILGISGHRFVINKIDPET